MLITILRNRSRRRSNKKTNRLILDIWQSEQYCLQHGGINGSRQMISIGIGIGIRNICLVTISKITVSLNPKCWLSLAVFSLVRFRWGRRRYQYFEYREHAYPCTFLKIGLITHAD